MIARSESSFPPVDPLRVATAAAVGVLLLAAGWALLHTGFYDDAAIVDTPVYEGYGDRMADGELPYRDFELEYPPGALPVFLLPSLGAEEDYDALFEVLMLICGAAAVALVAVTLGAVGVSTAALYGGVALAALSPLLLGPVVLTRFDLWPAALVAGALAALVTARDRAGLALLAVAVAAKLYPLVVVPVALLYVARRRGRNEAFAALAAFALVLALLCVPFAVAAPDGFFDSIARQTGRPLQIESLGAGVLLATDRLGLYDAAVVSSHGSQNLAGSLPDALASVQTVVQALAIVAVWVAFARSPGGPRALLAGSAAAVAAFVAFGKVLSPQFLIWLVTLVPLAAAAAASRALTAAAGLFAAALVTTQVWFPYRYWEVVALQPVAWLVAVRDVLLVALALVLLAATRRAREAPRTT